MIHGKHCTLRKTHRVDLESAKLRQGGIRVARLRPVTGCLEARRHTTDPSGVTAYVDEGGRRRCLEYAAHATAWALRFNSPTSEDLKAKSLRTCPVVNFGEFRNLKSNRSRGNRNELC